MLTKVVKGERRKSSLLELFAEPHPIFGKFEANGSES